MTGFLSDGKIAARDVKEWLWAEKHIFVADLLNSEGVLLHIHVLILFSLSLSNVLSAKMRLYKLKAAAQFGLKTVC